MKGISATCALLPLFLGQGVWGNGEQTAGGAASWMKRCDLAMMNVPPFCALPGGIR